MAKNYMPLGAKARQSLKKADKRGTAAIKAERQEALKCQQWLAGVQAGLLESGPSHTGPKVTVHVHGTDKGYAVHLDSDKKAGMIVSEISGGSSWSNTLAGIIVALKKLPPGCVIVFVVSNPEIAGTLNPEEMEQRAKAEWIEPETLQPRPQAELWKHIRTSRSALESTGPRFQSLATVASSTAPIRRLLDFRSPQSQKSLFN